MAKLEDRLAAGLESQGWVETRTVSDSWRRFGKFGRGAMYVLVPRGGVECAAAPATVNGLAFSPLHEVFPAVPVFGPIFEQVLLAGDKWLEQTQPDTQALLIELMDIGSDQRVNDRGGDDEDTNGEDHG